MILKLGQKIIAVEVKRERECAPVYAPARYVLQLGFYDEVSMTGNVIRIPVYLFLLSLSPRIASA